MDQDLISYLERFREEMVRKLEQVNDRLDRMDGRLDRMDGRLGGVEGHLGRVESRLEGVEGRLEQVETKLERVEENVRYARIEIEGVRDEVKLVAEAYIGLDERLTSVRVDLASEFSKVQSSIRQPFEYLDSRLRIIEQRADNVTRDALDLIRERLGKPAAPADPL